MCGNDAMPEKTTVWRCFHCDEVFTDREAAQLHFGEDCMSDAACQINPVTVREMEHLLARYRAEDSDTDRAMYRMQAEHTVALREAEEKGYRRGLTDIGASRVKTLFDAIAHGSEEHRVWLKKAIDDHFSDRPVEPPRG